MNEFFLFLETLRGAGWLYLWAILALAVGMLILELRTRRTMQADHPHLEAEESEQERMAA